MPIENTAPSLGFYGPMLAAAVGIPGLYLGAHGGLALSRHFEKERRKTEVEAEEAKFDAARRLMYEKGRGIRKIANTKEVEKISARVLDDNDPLGKVYEQHKQATLHDYATPLFGPGAAAAESTLLGDGASTGGDGSLRTMAGLGLLALTAGGAVGALHGATATSPSTAADLQKRILKRRLGVRDTKTYTPFISTYVAPADAVTDKYIDPSTR